MLSYYFNLHKKLLVSLFVIAIVLVIGVIAITSNNKSIGVPEVIFYYAKDSVGEYAIGLEDNYTYSYDFINQEKKLLNTDTTRKEILQLVYSNSEVLEFEDILVPSQVVKEIDVSIPYTYTSTMTTTSKYIEVLKTNGFIEVATFNSDYYIDMYLKNKDELVRIIIQKDNLKIFRDISKISMSAEAYIIEKENKRK